MDQVTPGRESSGSQETTKTSQDSYLARTPILPGCTKSSLPDNNAAFSRESGDEKGHFNTILPVKILQFFFFPSVLRATKLRDQQMAYPQKCYGPP